jgi:hypothetical protein
MEADLKDLDAASEPSELVRPNQPSPKKESKPYTLPFPELVF